MNSFYSDKMHILVLVLYNQKKIMRQKAVSKTLLKKHRCFPEKNIVFQHVHFYPIVLKRKIITVWICSYKLVRFVLEIGKETYLKLSSRSVFGGSVENGRTFLNIIFYATSLTNSVLVAGCYVSWAHYGHEFKNNNLSTDTQLRFTKPSKSHDGHNNINHK